MTLVLPDPTRTVPLSLREQAGVRDRWLTQRLLDLLPGLMDRAGIDLWLVIGREGTEDPVLATLLPATWLSARRRTVLALHRSDDGVTAAAVSRYPVGQFVAAWSAEDDGRLDERGQWACVRRIVEQAAPRRIGIDVSASVALADGLSHTDHEQLVDALGPWAQRLVPAEELVVGWLETRLPEEFAVLRALNDTAHEVVSEAFSPAVVRPGQTTAADVVWWIRQRLADAGLDPWFHPSVVVQRAGVPLTDDRLPALRGDTVITPGDLLSCDVGLSSLGLHTDTQRCAYVPRAGETSPPEGLASAMARANRLQDLTAAELRPGRTGDQVLAAARTAAAAEGLEAVVYSHPLGYHGHGAGPAIGLWDEQDGVPGAGGLTVNVDTAWALELAVRTGVPEWDGQVVRLPLEEGVALTAEGVDYLAGRQTELVVV